MGGTASCRVDGVPEFMSIETAPQEHRTTGVIPAAPWWVRAVNVLPGYRLAVTFNDGTSGTVDMSALVNSENAGIYATLKSAEVFQQVSIAYGALTWSNGADIDPVWMYEELGKNKMWSVPF
jgi:hypothetical protein